MNASNSVARPKKKFSLTTIIVYIAIIISSVIAAAVLGTKLDGCVKKDGKLDLTRFSNAEFSLTTLKESLSDGYAIKLIYLAITVIIIYILYKYSQDGNRFHRRGVEYGSAKWGDKKEIDSLKDTGEYKDIPFYYDNTFHFDENGDAVTYKRDNNIIYSKDVKLSLNTHKHRLNLNSLVVGGAGSGKTRFFCLPNLMQLNTSYVVTDPKGEILAATGKMLEKAGYKVRVFNTINMENSNNYNPFEYVYDHNGHFVEDNVLKLVDVLFSATKGDGEKEDFWSQKGKTMLQAIIFLLFEESVYDAKDENGNIIESKRDKTHLNFFSVTEKMRKLRYPPKNSQQEDGFFMEKSETQSFTEFEQARAKAFLCPLDKDFIELEKRNPDALALRLYKEVRNAPEETGQSFLSSANVKTFVYNLDNIRNLTCCDNINLETIGDEKTALFLIISATDSTYNFMTAMLYSQMFDTLANRANFKYHGTLPVHVRCIMDEFSNIGEIPNFEKVIAFVRSMGVSLNVIVQTISQLKAKYEKTYEIIMGNCDTTLFLGGKEESTLKSFSEILGKETIDIKGLNKTKGKTPSTSENNSIVGRELMQINELSTMPIDECIIMMRSHNPFHSKKYPLEEHPNYKYLSYSDKDMFFDVGKLKAVSISDLGLAPKTQAPVDVSAVKTEVESEPVKCIEKEVSPIVAIAQEETEKITTEWKHEKDVKRFGSIAMLNSPNSIVITVPVQQEEVKVDENNTLPNNEKEKSVDDVNTPNTEEKHYDENEKINNESVEVDENAQSVSNVGESMVFNDNILNNSTEDFLNNLSSYNNTFM